MNILEARLERANGGLAATAGSQRIVLGEETLSQRPALKQYAGREVILGIRPEDLEDASLADAPENQRLEGTVQLREALGSEIMVHFKTDATPAVTDETRELQRDVDRGSEGVEVPGASGDGGAVMVGRFGARSRVREDEKVSVAVDTRALHFFDPETGLGIYDDTQKGAAR
jgi:multiple sugar transport system ATP-binding protein